MLNIGRVDLIDSAAPDASVGLGPFSERIECGERFHFAANTRKFVMASSQVLAPTVC